jgi:hypothetical protein
VPGAVSGFELDARAAGFRAEFDVRHARGDIDFSWHGTIAGDESGRIEFLFDGRARSAFPYNRIGICVHHPWRETAGARYRTRTPEGEREGSFPDLIGQQAIVDGAYQALFPAYDRLEVELAGGGSLLFEFEGDLWETEDHRNWTDANFKTYSTPISLGRPAPLEAGQPLRQRLVVTPIDVPETTAGTGPVRLAVGAPSAPGCRRSGSARIATPTCPTTTSRGCSPRSRRRTSGPRCGSATRTGATAWQRHERPRVRRVRPLSWR